MIFKNKRPEYLVAPAALDEIGGKRIAKIENIAFEIVKLLQGKDKALRSWAIGRAEEVLKTKQKVETFDDYRRARRFIVWD
jgi:hypothetical protein